MDVVLLVAGSSLTHAYTADDTLIPIRHGLTAVTGSRLYGRTPAIHLDERGRWQAVALVEHAQDLEGMSGERRGRAGGFGSTSGGGT